MVTIPEVVREIVSREPYLEEALSRGIINLSALARTIRPQIEETLLKPVQEGAVIMALKRLEKETGQKTSPSLIFRSKPDIIVRSNLVEYTLSNSGSVIDSIRRLLEKNPPGKKHFLTFTQGVFETAIITGTEWKETVEQILEGERIIGRQEGLSSLTIILPESNVATPGVYYYILKALAWENINVIDVVSTKEEFTIMFNEEDIDRAFSILKKALR